MTGKQSQYSPVDAAFRWGGGLVLGLLVFSLVYITGSQRHDAGDGRLSERELEVLEAMAHGLITTQIGTQLFISENTVKTHIRHILEKLEVANRTEAVSKAIQMGLIQQTE